MASHDDYIRELELTIEGLSQENTELEQGIDELKTSNAELQKLVDLNRDRYSAAIRMIKSRQLELSRQRAAYNRLAAVHTVLVDYVIEVAKDIRALREVPADTLDSAAGQLANKLEFALVPE